MLMDFRDAENAKIKCKNKIKFAFRLDKELMDVKVGIERSGGRESSLAR